jgi:hypothetical protein
MLKSSECVKPLDRFKVMNPMSGLINQSLNMQILKIKCVKTCYGLPLSKISLGSSGFCVDVILDKPE